MKHIILTPRQECAFTARSRMDIPGTSKNDRWVPADPWDDFPPGGVHASPGFRAAMNGPRAPKRLPLGAQRRPRRVST